MPVVLLDTVRATEEERCSYWIPMPELILQTNILEEVPALLARVEKKTAEGYFAAGFLSYEAGFAFLPRMPLPASGGFPYVWFALTRNPVLLPPGELPSEFEEEGAVDVGQLQLNQTREQYGGAISKIRDYIEEGDTYQVNYTLRYRGLLSGSPRDLYARLRLEQRVSYAAYVETEDWAVLSLSPELFFRRNTMEIVTRPMKGTARRGRTVKEDANLSRELRESEKERSENLMIVDLLRNDLGKICLNGSVVVTHPLAVEKYETVLQMVSTVCGRPIPNAGLTDVFRATFPSGSVTGAPKIRTMQIIDELEGKEPRNIYTGAIGFVTRHESVFNVAIRTLLVDRKSGALEMGIGGGILYEADPAKEYEECLLKAKFLTSRSEEFQLLETILWKPDEGYVLLDFHLDRVMESAEYFMFAVSRAILEAHLRLRESRFRQENACQRVRLFVDRQGRVDVHSGALEPLPGGPVPITFSGFQTNSSDRFLFHKTTNRSLYVSELDRARAAGFFDVLFFNEKQELTEGAITNVFLEKQGVLYTPPVECGLLSGTYRRYLIESRTYPVREKILTREDVFDADQIYVCNSVRGLLRAEVITAGVQS